MVSNLPETYKLSPRRVRKMVREAINKDHSLRIAEIGRILGPKVSKRTIKRPLHTNKLFGTLEGWHKALTEHNEQNQASGACQNSLELWLKDSFGQMRPKCNLEGQIYPYAVIPKQFSWFFTFSWNDIVAKSCIWILIMLWKCWSDASHALSVSCKHIFINTGWFCSLSGSSAFSLPHKCCKPSSFLIEHAVLLAVTHLSTYIRHLIWPCNPNPALFFNPWVINWIISTTDCPDLLNPKLPGKGRGWKTSSWPTGSLTYSIVQKSLAPYIYKLNFKDVCLEQPTNQFSYKTIGQCTEQNWCGFRVRVFTTNID